MVHLEEALSNAVWEIVEFPGLCPQGPSTRWLEQVAGDIRALKCFLLSEFLPAFGLSILFDGARKEPEARLTGTKLLIVKTSTNWANELSDFINIGYSSSTDWNFRSSLATDARSP